MQKNSISEEQLHMLSSVSFLVGDKDKFTNVLSTAALVPFDDNMLEFLNYVSKELMSDREAKAYPDVITLAFWMRKANILKIKERFFTDDGNAYFGRGIAFHIAPSNVPVNYAYSLVAGLVTGNVNIIRIPSKDFPQVKIINNAINAALEKYEELSKYIYLVKYNRDKKINDLFSKLCDVRIIWGGDTTIDEIRNSQLSPRATEVTFADRYSLAIINSDDYLELEDKDRFSEMFYNDTYLTDQNACTSPRIVVWFGNSICESKKIFWDKLHDIVENKYLYQPIMGVNKLTSSYMIAAVREGVEIVPHDDNLLVRVKLNSVDDGIMQLRDNSGYFFEYDCKNLIELKALCDNTHCQTIGYLGNKDDLSELLYSGIKGVDRVVPIGKTMDFDFLWDGYNLFERLTRVVNICI